MIIEAPKERIAEYVSERTGCRFFGSYTALAFERDGEIKGAAIFDYWRGCDIEISVAGDEFPKSFLSACYRYVFEGLKCRRATLRTRTDHHAAINAALRIGAKIEGVQRGFYVGADALLLGVRPEEFKHGIV